MKKKIIITLCLLALFSFTDFLPAQEAPEEPNLNIPKHIEFKHLTVEDGLASNDVSTVLQDSRGFLWIGTMSGGLNKYDGVEFSNYVNVRNDQESLPNNCAWRLYQDKKENIWVVTWGGGLARFDPVRDVFITYNHDEKDENSLSSNLVWSVLVDGNDDLWVGTNGGLDKYDTEKNEFIHYRHVTDDPNSISNNIVTMVLEAAGGFLWVSTYGGGLNRFDPAKGTFTHYRHNEQDPRSLGNDFIHCMYNDEDGTLWLGSEGGLDKFDLKTETFTSYRYDEKDPQSLSGTPVTSIFRDSKQRLWVATNGHGLNLHEPLTDTFRRFENDRDDPHSLADDTVYDIYEDASGSLWVATFRGLDRYDSESSRFTHYLHYPGNPNCLSADSVQTFGRGNDGKLWIGTRGGGLNCFDPGSHSFTHYLHDPDNPVSLKSNTVLDIAQSQDNVLWIGTSAGLDSFDPQQQSFAHYQHNPDDPQTLNHDDVRSVNLAPDGFLWIGMYGGGLDRFDPASRTFTHFMPEQNNPNSLVSEWVLAVLIDSSGMIWVGTEGGLSRLDPESETFTNFVPKANDPHGLSDNYIQTIYQDEQGRVWVGTNSGLNRFNGESENFTVYNTSHGLAGDMVVSLISDKQGSLWIGTNKGLSKFDPQKETFRNYDVRDGLQGNQFNRNAVYESHDGELFFGGVNGFNSFFPGKLTDNLHVPPVVLTDFQLFNKFVGIGGDSPLQQHINVAEQIILTHNQSVFSFKFAALNYIYSEKNQYAYMMKGFDQDWTYVDSRRRFAAYTNLDPGEYTFTVKGSNNDGIWNEQGSSIKIKILPPWWETVWFRILFLVGLVGLVGAVFQWRIKDINAHRLQLELEVKERRQTEEALRESEDRYRGLASNIPGIVYRCACDDGWTMQYVSDYIEEISGYPPSDFIDNRVRTFESIVHRDDSQMDRKSTLNAIDRKEPYETEYRIVKADGTIRWVYEKGRAVFGANAEVLWLDGVIFDVTERKKAEENLNETLMFLDDIVESSYDSIIATDRQGYITRSNKAFQEMLGYTEEEITGRHISEMSPQETGTYESMSGEKIRIEDEFFSSAKEMIAELYENKKVSGWEVYSLTKDRKLVPVEESMVLLYNAADEVTGAVGVIRDITERRKADEERKRLQEQLTHAHKMEAIGTLAGGIAHDFNNILAGILGYAELSIDDTPQDGSVHGFLREIQKSTERASNLVNQILAFSRKNVQEMEPVKITPIIKETIKLLRATLPTTIELRHNITEHAAVVVADPTQIHQIMMNLCTNAAHAMPENSGLIDIGLTLESLNEADLKAYEGRPPGPYVKLSIRDNGSGIDHDIMGRVFDPFFTTKEVGKGTGMGLSVTHGIVESHGGLIKVESQPGEGTTFDVFLPQAQTGAEDVESYSGRIMPGTGHILFVDDEEMLVNIAQRMLSSLGYTVTSANSALEALEVFEKNPARFDLVITDQTMPKMTGHSLAKKIMEIRTDIPVILCSGYSETVTGEDAEKSGIKAFISKPLATVEISKIIHDVLNPQES